MRRICEEMALPLTNPNINGGYWKKRHIVAINGTTFALQDTASHTMEFRRYSHQNGEAAYPLARCAVLVETGTHPVFGARIGACHDSGIRLDEPLVKQLKPRASRPQSCFRLRCPSAR